MKNDGQVRNFPSPEGKALGSQMAKWCDDAEPNARLVMPDLPPRCASCAFRDGPHLANSSPVTQMDALKAVIEHKRFDCHDVHRDGEPCSGWVMMRLADMRDGPGTAPWEFFGGDN